MSPYQSKKDLPESVRDNLPAHAEEIYKEAFNSAFQAFQDPAKIRGDDDRETAAHKVAWGAVKRSYHKDAQGKWVKNS
jgi:cation transport regulator